MYQQNVATERRGTSIIVDYIEHNTGHRPTTITDPIQQQTIGDLLVTSARGTTSIELKIEQRYTGNIFVEVWSNREWGTPGWLFSSQSQIIIFYFLDADILIGVSMPALRHWLLNQADNRLDQYRSVRVKQSGRNDTHGIIVPIGDLRAAQLESYWEATPARTLEALQREKAD